APAHRAPHAAGPESPGGGRGGVGSRPGPAAVPASSRRRGSRAGPSRPRAAAGRPPRYRRSPPPARSAAPPPRRSSARPCAAAPPSPWGPGGVSHGRARRSRAARSERCRLTPPPCRSSARHRAHAARLGPPFDRQFVLRLGQLRHRQLAHVEAVELRVLVDLLRPHRREDLQLAATVGDLLHNPGELRVAAPLWRVVGAAVEREARVAGQVGALPRPRHRTDPEVVLDEPDLDAADPRRAVGTHGRDRLVDVRVEHLTRNTYQLRRNVLDFSPTCHGPDATPRPPALRPTSFGRVMRTATLFDADAASYTGTVEVLGVIFRAEDDGYAVLEVQEAGGGDGFALVGPVAHLSAGDRAEVSGEWQTHSRYGRQLRAPGAPPLHPTARAG